MNFQYQDLKIYYEKIGTGPPLIFLHGWGISGETFNKIKNDFPYHQVYIIDLPGFGKSDELKTEYSLNDYVDFLKTFITTLKLEEVTILGHSFGGRLAIRYSSKYYVKKLILVDAAGIRRFSLKNWLKIKKYKAYKKWLKLTNQQEAYQKYLKNSGSVDYRNASLIMKLVLKKIVKTDQRKDLMAIQAPTLIIWGLNDLTTPYKDALLIHHLIKNSALITFKNSEHFPYLSEPIKFKLILQNFVEENR